MSCCDDDKELSASDIITTESECVDTSPVQPCPATTVIQQQSCSAPAIIPVPYFLDSAQCVQNHSSPCNSDNEVDIKVANAFNLPACGKSALLSVPSIDGMMIGGYLWNPNFGYLRAINFDAATHMITVQNDCQAGNAPIGTSVPACTRFLLAPPPAVQAGGGLTTGPYLAVDFTAPPVGQCINLSVTTAAGLVVGKSTAIAGGTYRISSVVNASTITACNDGAGVTPNTQVLARNSSGDLQYPLILLDDNACSHTPVFSGKILVCHDGITAPLAGLLDGQIPVYDEGTAEVEFKSLGIPVVNCTALTVGLTLDPLNPPGSAYLGIVGDTTGFIASDFVTLGDVIFTVDTVDDGTHLHVIPTVDPVAIVSFPAGSPLCQASFGPRLTLIENTIYLNQNANGHKTRESTGASATSTDVTSGTLTAGGAAVTATEGNISVVNAADLPMDVRVSYEGAIQCVLHDTAAQYAQVNHALLISQGVAPGAVAQVIGRPRTFVIPAAAAGGTALHGSEITHEEIFTIPANTTWIFKFNSSFQYAAGNAANITVAHHTARIVLSGTSQL